MKQRANNITLTLFFLFAFSVSAACQTDRDADGKQKILNQEQKQLSELCDEDVTMDVRKMILRPVNDGLRLFTRGCCYSVYTSREGYFAGEKKLNDYEIKLLFGWRTL